MFNFKVKGLYTPQYLISYLWKTIYSRSPLLWHPWDWTGRTLSNIPYFHAILSFCALGSYVHSTIRLSFFNYHRPSHRFRFGIHCCKPFTQYVSAKFNFFHDFSYVSDTFNAFSITVISCIYHFLSMVPSEEMDKCFNILHFKMFKKLNLHSLWCQINTIPNYNRYEECK